MEIESNTYKTLQMAIDDNGHEDYLDALIIRLADKSNALHFKNDDIIALKIALKQLINSCDKHTIIHSIGVALHHTLITPEEVMLAILHDLYECNDILVKDIGLKDSFSNDSEYHQLINSEIYNDLIIQLKLITRDTHFFTYIDYIKRIAKHGGSVLNVKVVDILWNLDHAMRDDEHRLTKSSAARYAKALSVLLSKSTYKVDWYNDAKEIYVKETLREFLKDNSGNKSYSDLGYTEEWLIAKIAKADTDRTAVEADYFMEWIPFSDTSKIEEKELRRNNETNSNTTTPYPNWCS